MKVLWDDTVGSFLDPSGSPVFPNGDAGAPSAGGGVTFGTQAVLWDQPGTPPVAGPTGAGNATPDTSPSESSHLLWADPGNAPQTWNIAATWSANGDPAGAVGGFDGNGTTPTQPAGDAPALLWQPAAPLPQPAAPLAQPTTPVVPQNGSPANTGTSATTNAADNGGCNIGGVWYPDGTNMILMPGQETHWNLAPIYLECRDGTAYYQNTDTPWIPLPGK
jgi:hypothetical protein